MDKKPGYITFPLFDQFPELTCVFSTRKGGFSTGSFSSLNLGMTSGDNPETVHRNRVLFFASLRIEGKQISISDQIHSANIAIVEQGGIHRKTDALVTMETEMYLAIQTADCFPVFLYAPQNRVAAAVHAGWRGILKNIIPDIIALMKGKFRVDEKSIYTVIGPGLQKECFEVRQDVSGKFPASFLQPHADVSKKYLDLQGLIVSQLEKSGLLLSHIGISDQCTKCLKEMYYSYRRDGRNSGRMMGVLGIKSKSQGIYSDV